MQSLLPGLKMTGHFHGVGRNDLAFSQKIKTIRHFTASVKLLSDQRRGL